MEGDEEILKKEFAYDFFIDENPDVQERVERARVEGLTQGFQDATIKAIEIWFPTLLAEAQPLIKQFQNIDELKELIEQLASATSEDQARRILHIQEK